MGSKIAAQLYTLRDFTKTPDDIKMTMEKVRAIGYESVQLSALGPMDPAELRAVCDSNGRRSVRRISALTRCWKILTG